MIAEGTVTKEQVIKIYSILFKYESILLFIIKMEPSFAEGECKTTITLKGDQFLFKSLRKFLRENKSEIWEEFFQEKK